MITIISGFGRCGSSLVMQMLEAGGMQVSGEYPAFEDAHGSMMRADQLTADVMWAIDGRAVKLLDPHLGTIPKGPEYRVIWLTRNKREQARSQVKFLNTMLGLHEGNLTVLKFVQSYIDDEPLAMIHLRAVCLAMLFLPFEGLLINPRGAAMDIKHYIGDDTLDVDAMAKAVRPRSPLCADGMDMELTLIRERRAA